MLQNLYEDLAKLLESNERYLVDGMLSKDKVAEDALAMDSDLLKVLTTNESIKNHFFGKVGAILVFDKVKFQKFVLNCLRLTLQEHLHQKQHYLVFFQLPSQDS